VKYLNSILIGVAIIVLILLLTISAAFSQIPDPALTPGAVRNLSKDRICSTRWTKLELRRDERRVTKAMKRKVFAAYGYAKGNKDPRCPCEIDHLIPRSIGGADDIRNLFPQPFRGAWNARQKDVLEHRLHKEVCAGRLELGEAQQWIAKDWPGLYRKYYGEPR
jgi:hypothetical protein